MTLVYPPPPSAFRLNNLQIQNVSSNDTFGCFLSSRWSDFTPSFCNESCILSTDNILWKSTLLRVGSFWGWLSRLDFNGSVISFAYIPWGNREICFHNWYIFGHTSTKCINKYNQTSRYISCRKLSQSYFSTKSLNNFIHFSLFSYISFIHFGTKWFNNLIQFTLLPSSAQAPASAGLS